MAGKLQEHADRFYGDPTAKSVAEGVSKGAYSLGKGIYGGAVGLVLKPVVGAKREGVVGFAKGAISGLGGLVGLPIGGVIQGSRQIGSGVMHTPAALYKAMLAKDKAEQAADTAEVADSAHNAQAAEKNAETYKVAREAVLAACAKGEDPGSGGSKGRGAAVREKRFAVESELYDALNLNPDATADEITRNFMRLSKQFHPSSHPGDSNALRRFNEVSEAYQILGDPAKRALYDKYGKASLADDFADPGAFFTLQFGAGRFEPYAGELLAAYAAGRVATKEELDAFQGKRERTLGALLVARLEPWLRGQEEVFVASMLEEAKVLKNQPYGDKFLQVLGYTYYNSAEVILGLESSLGVPGYVRLIGLKAHATKTRYKAILSAMQLRDLQLEMQQEGQTEVQEQDLPQFLQDIWLVSVVDIESTVQRAVEIATKGAAAFPNDQIQAAGAPVLTKDEKAARAKGIMKLGKIFLTVGSGSDTRTEQDLHGTAESGAKTHE